MNALDQPDYQKKLFPYAYNILGSSDDAYDVIQDVMIKYMSGGKTDLVNERAYLIKSVVNRSINLKKRNKRIRQQGMWLPDPIATEEADRDIKRKEIASYSLLVLLEYLNPKERAVFILKEAFDYSHEEIAETLSISTAHSRKLLSRGKSELKMGNQFFKTASDATSAYLQEYILYIKNGDVKALANLLSKEISLKADGGAKIKVVSEQTTGVPSVIDLLLYLYKQYQHEYTIKLQTANHQPALLFYDKGTLVNCQIFEIDTRSSTISNIFSVVDPEKLNHIAS